MSVPGWLIEFSVLLSPCLVVISLESGKWLNSWFGLSDLIAYTASEYSHLTVLKQLTLVELFSTQPSLKNARLM